MLVDLSQFTNCFIPQLRVLRVQPLDRYVEHLRVCILKHYLLYRLELRLLPVHSFWVREQFLVKTIRDVVIHFLHVLCDERLVLRETASCSTVSSQVTMAIYVERVSNEITILRYAGVVLELVRVHLPSEYRVLLQFLRDDVLKLEKHVSETAIVLVFFTEYSIDYGEEVLDDTIREQFNAFEVKFAALDVRQSDTNILFLLLLVSHLLVLFVDLRRNAVLLERRDVFSYTKDVRRAAADVVQVRR